MRGGSESEDRSLSRDADSFPWWDRSVEIGQLDTAVRRIADEIVRAVEGSGDQVEPDGLRTYDGEASLDRTWEAVSALHRSLDQCHGSAPPEEIAEARRRLVRETGRLWSAGIEAEVRAVRDFMAEVAHDFRSPLHSSLFLTDALFRDESGSLSAAQKRQLSVIHSAVNALLRLANDLLDFAESDGEVAPREAAEIPFSPRQVVSDLEDLLEPIIFYKDATLDTDVEAARTRVGDPQLLHRVLLNLVSNALEAVEEDETVRLRVGGDEDRLRAVIENHARDANLERMGELLASGDYSSVLSRLEGQTRGLGLVISGRMIRAADGTVDIEGEEDGLTRVSVTLPFPVLDDDG